MQKRIIALCHKNRSLIQTLGAALSDAGYEVVSSTRTPDFDACLKSSGGAQLFLLDEQLFENGLVTAGAKNGNEFVLPSGVQVIFLAKEPGPRRAVEAMRMGACDYLSETVDGSTLLLSIEHAFRNTERGHSGNECSAENAKPILTNSSDMENLLKIARQVAASNATVLIQGESGTGKELIARYIHAHSGRRPESFVAMNCAALPDSLAESELFGYEKGAFT
ncbi:MAG: sigma 54-interacting transcriptional regulator, partial [Desulfosarcinaceae bacterium]